jgi:sugar phosphate isomerase/epimerase
MRMNWAGYTNDTMKTPEALQAFIDRSTPPLRELCDYADKKKLDLIIENHGGPSYYPDAFIALIKKVDHPRFGTLPDFGNFPKDVDRYDAIDRLMPHAKAVSAKCYDFNETTGDETTLDFPRLIANVVDKHGYHGNLGIEYEGDRMSEFDGVKACKKLLEKLRG